MHASAVRPKIATDADEAAIKRRQFLDLVQHGLGGKRHDEEIIIAHADRRAHHGSRRLSRHQQADAEWIFRIDFISDDLCGADRFNSA